MQVRQVLTMMMRVMIMGPMMFIGGIIITVSTDAKLSLVILSVIPVIVGSIIIVAKKGIPLFKTLQKKMDGLNLVLRERLTGIRVIRSFNRVDLEKQRFNQVNKGLTQNAIKVNRVIAALTPIMMLVLNFSTIAIIWFGSIRISNGNLQVGELMAFIQYAMQIMFSLIMSSMMFVMIPRASVSASRINEILDAVSDINDKNEAQEKNKMHGHIEFQNVSYSYPGAEKRAISELPFRADLGEMTAIVGGSGAGKSTLINMLPRFYDPDTGSIQIDHVDLAI